MFIYAQLDELLLLSSFGIGGFIEVYPLAGQPRSTLFSYSIPKGIHFNKAVDSIFSVIPDLIRDLDVNC